MKTKSNYIRLLIISVFLTAGICTCKNSNTGQDNLAGDGDGTPVIEFSQMVHNFGKIEEGEKVACVFTFENKGDADLLISSATTSCGCTVPKYDDKPVQPGGKGTVEVVFDSSYRNGAQNKTIAIRSNAKRPVVILSIKAEVITKN
jgi:hypothetical protein